MKNLLIISALLLAQFSLGQIVNIPDANFKNALVNSNCVDIDGDGYGDVDADTNNDGEIQVNEAEAVLGLNVRSQDINSLEGIQNFFNLTYLNCGWNNLEDIDINTLLNLEVLLCEHNNLTTVNVDSMVNLQILSVEANRNLISLDVSQNINLEGLYAFDTPISSLDTTQNPLLEILWLGINNITELDLSQNGNLRRLLCHTNQLTSLNIKNGNNINMDTMVAYSNPNLNCIMVDDENASRSPCSNNLFGWCPGGAVYREDCNLGVSDEVLNNKITTYPNPVETYISIMNKSGEEIKEIKIYNIIGELILDQQQHVNQLNLSNLKSGTYIVFFETNKSSYTKRILKK